MFTPGGGWNALCLRKRLRCGGKCHKVGRRGASTHPGWLAPKNPGFVRTGFCCQGVHVFVGQYEHSLDNKGRVVLPAPFRSYVAERGYVTQLDGCVGLWSAEGFKTVAERWKSELDDGSISAGVFRKLMGRVQEVKVDGAGRITLSKELLDALDFESKVIVSGRFDRAEIWPLERFESEQTEEDDIEFNETVRRLGI